MRDGPSDTYPSAMAEMARKDEEICRLVAELLAPVGQAEPTAWWRAGIAEALASDPGHGWATPLRKSCGTDRP